MPAWVEAMIGKGQLGDKTKGGFYKKAGADIHTLDYKTGEYRAKGGDADLAKAAKGLSRTEDPRERVKKTVATEGKIGQFAWTVLSKSLAYAARRIPEITDSVENIDNAMKRGYTWALGPSEEQDFGGMVIWNQGELFCVGANLFAGVMAAGQKQWDGLRETVKGLQYALQRMKYSRVPVIAAPYNMTLGGGLEVCFGADGVQAAAETYAGLVEVGVGLIPGGGGCKNMLWRAMENVPEGTELDTYAFVTQTFKNIARAKVATSAEEAKSFGYFRGTDGVSFDRARQLHEAKQRAIGLATAGYHPPAPRAYKLPGEHGIATLQLLVNTLVAGKYASEHDAKIAMKLGNVLCGGVNGLTHAVTVDEMLELEREAFVSLCGEPLSQARMQYMLQNSKPLRNYALEIVIAAAVRSADG